MNIIIWYSNDLPFITQKKLPVITIGSMSWIVMKNEGQDCSVCVCVGVRQRKDCCLVLSLLVTIHERVTSLSTTKLIKHQWCDNCQKLDQWKLGRKTWLVHTECWALEIRWIYQRALTLPPAPIVMHPNIYTATCMTVFTLSSICRIIYKLIHPMQSTQSCE